jgi:PKD repeat protein
MRRTASALPTNPYYDGSVTSVASRIWSARYRNPFRFEFDPAAPIPNVLYISENGDGTDRLAQIAIGADGGWDNQFTVNSADGKRIVMQTSDPSKTALSIVRGGPFSPGGAPVLYNARYGGGTRNEVRRWTLTGTNLNVLTPIAADNGDAFYRGYENRGIVDFEIGPDGAMYYTDSGQGASLGTGFRLGRIRFVGGLPPVADFTANPLSGTSPLTVNFTDTSTSASNTITSWNWSFGDGAISAMQHPSHTYQTPGVYTVQLAAMDELGLTATKESIVTVVHPTAVHVSGAVYDGRSLPPTQLASATELRFYQMDGSTPLSILGGTGLNSNVLNLSAGGVVDTSVVIQITGPGMVISAGEASGDSVEPALIGVPLSVVRTNQSVSATFWLSDTMLRGRVTDTLGNPARVDVGVSRLTPGAYVAFAGGRDFRPGSGFSATGLAHRTEPDVLGFYHVPVVTGQGDVAFILDTSLDTLSATHGRVMSTVTVQSAASTIRDLTVGLYDGGSGEADLSGIPETPDVDFELQIQTIFSSSCAACHNDIASNSGGLDLQAGAALGELINKLSVEARGVKLVDPGSPERSYLMEKINAAIPQIGTSMRPGDPMSLSQRALIRDWIRQLSPSGTIEFTSSDYSVTEGAESVTATITVRRTGSSIGTVGATVSTISGGTATPTSDYTVTSVPFAWDHLDQTDKVFSVSINSDNLAEGDETVVVGLGTLTGGAVTGLLGSTTLTIRDRAVDHWRYSEFGTNANTPNGLVTADFDNDGISNLAEYGLGTDPSVANSNPGTSAQIVPPGLLEYSFASTSTPKDCCMPCRLRT